MPTRNISLTEQQDEFVRQVVDSGEYQNASETIRDALRALQQRRREDRARVKALRAEIAVGIAAADRGEYDVVELKDMRAYLDGLTPRPTPAKRRRR